LSVTSHQMNTHPAVAASFCNNPLTDYIMQRLWEYHPMKTYCKKAQFAIKI